MKKTVLFYSSLKDLELFNITGFYSTDIKILKDLGYHVKLSNSFLDFFKIKQYDISFIYFWTKGVLPAIISRLLRKKVIITGGIDSLDSNYNTSKLNYFIKKYLFKICTVFSNANIIVSESDLNNIYKTGFDFNNIFLLPHVINFELYKYDDRPKKNIITSIVWMETSNINVIRKGVDKLFYVYHFFKKLNPDFKLVIIGSIGSGTDYLLSIAREIGIESDIFFTGRIREEEKVNILKESKYHFQLSLYEGFGISALEALASGNIVFHSGKGGLLYTIGYNGVLIDDIFDYERIANVLYEYNLNYDSNKFILKKNINYVENNFSYNIRLNGIGQILKSFEM